MRVRSGRFMRSVHTHPHGLRTECAQDRHLEPAPRSTGPVGFHCRGASRRLLRPASHVWPFMIGHSREAPKHYYGGADFCTITPRVTTRRAVASMMIAADSSHAAGSSLQRLVLDIPVEPSGSVTINTHRPRRRSPQVRTRTVGASQGLGPLPHQRRIYRRLRTAGLRCHVPARLASLGLVCGFCPSPRTSCTRASSGHSLAGLPLPSARLVVILRSR